MNHFKSWLSVSIFSPCSGLSMDARLPCRLLRTLFGGYGTFLTSIIQFITNQCISGGPST
jgi:hypothetical protein